MLFRKMILICHFHYQIFHVVLTYACTWVARQFISGCPHIVESFAFNISDLKGLLSHSNEWQIGLLNLDMTIGFIDAENNLTRQYCELLRNIIVKRYFKLKRISSIGKQTRVQNSSTIKVFR